MTPAPRKLFPHLKERFAQRDCTMSGGEQQILAIGRADGVTVFLVEQNANQALKIADRAYVLENGGG
jgi:branched-chain amino acid transport system ATP-binding protein